jgi:hypothetical protein
MKFTIHCPLCNNQPTVDYLCPNGCPTKLTRYDKPRVIILRGVSGSGKSAFYKKFPGIVCSADQFFMVGTEYRFDSYKDEMGD